jgi:ADP-dependent NAD(P)H-hydrate dehydratase / NAD(P)H-hydrate epimerase
VKILSAAQIREGDAFTIKNEPIKAVDLMERAGERCFEWIYDNAPKVFPANTEERDWIFNVFCGVGNNGGDGLVIARLLGRNGYEVRVFIVEFSQQYTPEFEANLARLQKSKVPIKFIRTAADVPAIEAGSMVIDAIFGTGLSRKVEGVAAEVIQVINQSFATIVAVDLPSGLNDADNSDNNRVNIVNAHITLALEFFKLSFFFPENECHVGIVKLIKIGIHSAFTNSVETPNYLTLEADIKSILKERNKFGHKGLYGNLIILAGSYGKYGAACLAAKGALKAGVGLTSVFAPKTAMSIIQTSVTEAMFIASEDDNILKGKVNCSGFDAAALGPGIGTATETQQFVKELIKNTSVPLVLDADALNCLSMNPEWFQYLPPYTVLTPHPGEFSRMAGEWTNDYERYCKQVAFSEKYKVVVVLKGAHTAISTPDGRVFFNTTGNSGMATAGCGDVLTGVIGALLAQGYNSVDSSLIGVYIHGKAGDIALWDTGYEALTATDVINCLGKAFLSFTLPSNK